LTQRSPPQKHRSIYLAAGRPCQRSNFWIERVLSGRLTFHRFGILAFSVGILVPKVSSDELPDSGGGCQSDAMGLGNECRPRRGINGKAHDSHLSNKAIEPTTSPAFAKGKISNRGLGCHCHQIREWKRQYLIYRNPIPFSRWEPWQASLR
jgi:hypothetical protein